jgi:tRNA U34 5-methylaminomethyl-2-thiouridine-forming methyltransferase MnmC
MNELVLTSDGSHTLSSERYGVHYHSKYGAIQESKHVFLEAGLHFKMLGRTSIDILEIGFGTGLNAFLTWLAANEKNWAVRYTTVEAYPVSQEVAAALNYPEILQQTDHRSVLQAMHDGAWGVPYPLGDTFLLTKLLQRFEEITFSEAFDLIYFDAFAPGAQPELWGPEVLGAMYRALRPGGALTTYCAKGSVKRQFRDLGFEVQAIPGPPGKREMTRVIKPLT